MKKTVDSKARSKVKPSDGAKQCGARENQPGMSDLVKMYQESRGGCYSDTVFERRKYLCAVRIGHAAFFAHLRRLKSRWV